MSGLREEYSINDLYVVKFNDNYKEITQNIARAAEKSGRRTWCGCANTACPPGPISENKEKRPDGKPPQGRFLFCRTLVFHCRGGLRHIRPNKLTIIRQLVCLRRGTFLPPGKKD